MLNAFGMEILFKLAIQYGYPILRNIEMHFCSDKSGVIV